MYSSFLFYRHKAISLIKFKVLYKEVCFNDRLKELRFFDSFTAEVSISIDFRAMVANELR